MTDLPAYDYTFPVIIAPTDLQPDVVLWSSTQKSAIIVVLDSELTLKMHTGEKQTSMRIWLRQEGVMQAL